MSKLKSKVIYLLPITIVIVATFLYLSFKSDGLLSRIDNAMLKADYLSYCLNVDLEVESCNTWAEIIITEWPESAKECSDQHLGNYDAMGSCVDEFMADETYIGSGG